MAGDSRRRGSVMLTPRGMNVSSLAGPTLERVPVKGPDLYFRVSGTWVLFQIRPDEPCLLNETEDLCSIMDVIENNRFVSPWKICGDMIRLWWIDCWLPSSFLYGKEVMEMYGESAIFRI